jgi:arylsulfatase A-like enzyme
VTARITRGLGARLFWLACALGAATAVPACADDRPNIVVFTGDDHSRLDAGCYGNPTIATPAIDGIAAAGLAFERCMTVTAICCPSRAALLTGQYPFASGCFGLKECNADVRPLSAILADAGYRCGLVGKRHLGPWEAFRFEYAPPDPKSLDRGRDTATYIDDVRGFFDHLRDAGSRGPFFLMVNFHDPHRAFPMPADVPEPVDRSKIAIPPTLPDTPDIREEVGRYYDAVQRMDRGIGLCLDALRESGFADNTIVIYTSDHGAAFPFAKSTLYEAGLNVPFVMAWPGRIAAGRRMAALVSFVDVAPTLLELTGLPIPPTMQGRSFAAVVRAETDAAREVVFGSQTDDFMVPSYPIRSVRTESLKYIYNVYPERHVGTNAMAGLTWRSMLVAGRRGDDAIAARVAQYTKRPREELYDLAADPIESRNLAADSSRAADLDAMRARLVAHMDETGDPFVALLPFATEAQRARARPAFDAYEAYDAERTRGWHDRPRGLGDPGD